MRVWKYPLEVAVSQTLRIPKGWQFLAIQTQLQLSAESMAEAAAGALIPTPVPTMWVIVDENAEEEDVTISMAGTGRPMAPSQTKANYLATVQTGAYVWHFFHEAA